MTRSISLFVMPLKRLQQEGFIHAAAYTSSAEAQLFPFLIDNLPTFDL
ncbi:MAG: hypothetical protein WCT14_01355 [Treponemataceae bacterium]